MPSETLERRYTYRLQLKISHALYDEIEAEAKRRETSVSEIGRERILAHPGALPDAPSSRRYPRSLAIMVEPEVRNKLAAIAKAHRVAMSAVARARLEAGRTTTEPRPVPPLFA